MLVANRSCLLWTHISRVASVRFFFIAVAASAFILFSISPLVAAPPGDPQLADVLPVSPGHVFSPMEQEVVTGVVYRVPLVLDDDGNHVAGPGPSDNDMLELKKLTKLNYVRLTKSHVSHKGVRVLAEVPSIEALFWFRMDLADEKLAIIKDLPNLEELKIPDSDITNASAKSISQMTSLRWLDLTNAKVDSEFFQEHRLPDSLTHLNLRGTNVDSSVLSHLPGNITHLALSGTEVDETIIPQLLKRKNLRVLVTPRFSPNAIEEIRQGLPGVQVNENAFFGF